MTERVSPGAIVYSPDADLTGSPDRSVNLLQRFMVMTEHFDFGNEGMTADRARNMLLGGLTLATADLESNTKVNNLVRETVDRDQTYRKLRDEPQPTLRMMAIMAKMNPRKYALEVAALRAEPDDSEQAVAVGDFDRQGFIDLRARITENEGSMVSTARIRAHSESDGRHIAYAEGEQS